MHTLFLLLSFSVVYLALWLEARKIDSSTTWMHRTQVVCYVLGATLFFIYAAVFDFFTMALTESFALHVDSLDIEISLAIGAILCILLAISFGRALWGQWRIRQILKLVTPCQDPVILGLVQSLSERMGIESPQLLTYWSEKPYAAMLFSKEPVILLSSWMLKSLDDEELGSVLCHELAHLARKDGIMVSIIGILANVLFFVPLIQRAWNTFLVDLETAADDLAVLVTKKPEALASAIVKVHQARPECKFTYGINYFTPDFYQIEARVERLLNPDISRPAELFTTSFSSLLFNKVNMTSFNILLIVLCALMFIPCAYRFIDQHFFHLLG